LGIYSTIHNFAKNQEGCNGDDTAIVETCWDQMLPSSECTYIGREGVVTYFTARERCKRGRLNFVIEGIEACGFFCWVLCASLLASCMVIAS